MKAISKTIEDLRWFWQLDLTFLQKEIRVTLTLDYKYEVGMEPQQKMVANNHNILFSVPTLKMAINIANGSLWHISPICFWVQGYFQ